MNTFHRIAAFSLFCVVFATGCKGDRVQSALHPSGPAAHAVAQLWWLLLTILGIYSIAVFLLTFVAIFYKTKAAASSPSSGRTFILVGGVILPLLILVPLLTYSLSTTTALRQKDGGLTIRVVGHRWWWEVEYPDHRIVTANELYIPVGEPVRLELEAKDVIHSFWVPQLHGKMDMIPGHPNTFWIQADKPGSYRGQCAEYCGMQHAHMAFQVEALPPEQFVQWLESNRSSASAMNTTAPLRPMIDDDAMTDDGYSLGKQAFLRNGCGVCHAIEGTRAKGRAGPDLTLIGNRQTLAAATLPNTSENLFRWLADPQAIKPGAKMPKTETSDAELNAIVAYLLTLRGQETTNASE